MPFIIARKDIPKDNGVDIRFCLGCDGKEGGNGIVRSVVVAIWLEEWCAREAFRYNSYKEDYEVREVTVQFKA